MVTSGSLSKSRQKGLRPGPREWNGAFNPYAESDKFKRSCNPVGQLCNEVVKTLAKWKPYYYYVGANGTIYLKFPHWKLGTIRLANHPGKKKYSYLWRIRTDYKRKWMTVSKHNDKTYYEFGPECLWQFYQKFEERAAYYGIKPGQKEKYSA